MQRIRYKLQSCCLVLQRINSNLVKYYWVIKCSNKRQNIVTDDGMTKKDDVYFSQLFF